MLTVLGAKLHRLRATLTEIAVHGVVLGIGTGVAGNAVGVAVVTHPVPLFIGTFAEFDHRHILVAGTNLDTLAGGGAESCVCYHKLYGFEFFRFEITRINGLCFSNGLRPVVRNMHRFSLSSKPEPLSPCDFQKHDEAIG